MAMDSAEDLVNDFVGRVRRKVAREVASLGLPGRLCTAPSSLMPGKMLRTRFGARLAFAGTPRVEPSILEDACAATELLHTATLCHDDVIDNAALRRSVPALWKVTAPSAAILIGDWLLCGAIRLLAGHEGTRHLTAFLDKVQETCRTEVEHEMAFRGERLDVETCLRLARGKTGPLFSFVGMVCGGEDADLGKALEEAGYCIGTGYQLADDLLDLVGREEDAGKTLGTDAARAKSTLLDSGGDGRLLTREHANTQFRKAWLGLAPWPEVRRGLRAFLDQDLMPVLRSVDSSWEMNLGQGTSD